MEDWTKVIKNRFIDGFDIIKFTKSNPLLVTIEKVGKEMVYSKEKKQEESQIVLWLSVNGKPWPKPLLLVKKIARPLTIINNMKLDPDTWVGSKFHLWQKVETHFGITGPVLKAGIPRN